MSTEKPQSERCTTSANKESVRITDRSTNCPGCERDDRREWTEPHDHTCKERESITDHQTKALRPDDGTGDRAATILHYRGPFRVYFKPNEDYPRVVSIDNGSHSWEILCKSVKIESLALKTTKHPTNDYPIALEGFGWVQVDGNGAAVIS